MTNLVSTQDAVETWKLAHRFVLDTYRLTNNWPREEHYGLIPKVRNSSVKIASNIVEGYSRQSADRYRHHLTDSLAALEETKYSLLVARDLGYLADQLYDRIMNDAEDLSERLEGLQRQLAGGRAVEPSPDRPPAFGVKKGVRQSFSGFWSWFVGGSSKQGSEQKRLSEPAVWKDEAPATSYLDEIQE